MNIEDLKAHWRQALNTEINRDALIPAPYGHAEFRWPVDLIDRIMNPNLDNSGRYRVFIFLWRNMVGDVNTVANAIAKYLLWFVHHAPQLNDHVAKAEWHVKQMTGVLKNPESKPAQWTAYNRTPYWDMVTREVVDPVPGRRQPPANPPPNVAMAGQGDELDVGAARAGTPILTDEVLADAAAAAEEAYVARRNLKRTLDDATMAAALDRAEDDYRRERAVTILNQRFARNASRELEEKEDIDSDVEETTTTTTTTSGPPKLTRGLKRTYIDETGVLRKRREL